jgi:hypothetical protein
MNMNRNFEYFAGKHKGNLKEHKAYLENKEGSMGEWKENQRGTYSLVEGNTVLAFVEPDFEEDNAIWFTTYPARLSEFVPDTDVSSKHYIKGKDSKAVEGMSHFQGLLKKLNLSPLNLKETD